jgi:hypothetical protein
MLAQTAVTDDFQSMLSQILTFIPRLLAFLLIVVIGWFVAKAIAKILDRVLERVGFDRAVERGGVGRALAPTEYDASTILSKIVFYTLLLLVLQLAFGLFGPNPISDLLFSVIAFLPRVFVAIVIVVVAAAAGSAVRDLVSSSLHRSSSGPALANLAGGTIMVIGAFAALDQLRIAPAIVTGLFYALLAIIAGSAIIAIGGGGIRPMRRRWEQALDRLEGDSARRRTPAPAHDYEELTREELDEFARERDLRGRSTMTKDELAAALRRDDETHELRRRPAYDPLPTDTNYDQQSYDELMALAQERDQHGRSGMSKEELILALRHYDRTHEPRLGSRPLKEHLEQGGHRLEDDDLRRRATTSAQHYEDLTREELDVIARSRDLEGRSKMTKNELAAALRRDDQTQELREV